MTDDINLDTTDADQALRQQARHLDSRSLVQAARRAINRGARTARSELSKGIRERLNVRARDLKERMTLRRATDTNLEATIEVDGEQLPLHLFRANQIARGVSLRVLKGGGRSLIPSAFISQALNNRVAIRVGGAPRLPIHVLRGPSMRKSAELAWDRRASAAAARMINNRLDHELGRAIERANR